MFGQPKLVQCLNVKAGIQSVKLQREKKTTKSSYVLLSRVLIHLHVEHVFTVAVADNVRETNSLIECK